MGGLPPGDAEILVTAHYHHLRMKQQGDRTWFQAPSIDKSIDFTERTGLWSHPGVLKILLQLAIKDGITTNHFKMVTPLYGFLLPLKSSSG